MNNDEFELRWWETATVVIVLLIVAFTVTDCRMMKGEEDLKSVVYMMDTEIEGGTSVVYLDDISGWSIVWVIEGN